MPLGLGSDDIHLILTSPQPAAVLARQLGVSHQAVCDVRNNKTHKDIHPHLPRFNKFTTRRLKPEHVDCIRSSKEPLSTLSKRFNVSERTIISVRRGETYKDVGIAGPRSRSDLHCANCMHWDSGCGLGFPEALEDLTFAAECSLFAVNSNHHALRKLKAEDIDYIRSSTETLDALSKRFNVSLKTIHSARRGDTYRDVS
jgi:hypothetical protein